MAWPEHFLFGRDFQRHLERIRVLETYGRKCALSVELSSL